MPTITRLVAGKKNPHRVNLYLDGSYACSLSIDEVVKHSLKKGLVLTLEQLNSLRQTDNVLRDYAKILNFLSYRPRSESEVRARLRQYKCSDIESVITKLYAHSHLDDLAFARWFVDSRTLHKTRSPRALQSELTRKGIGRAIIDQVLVGLPDPRATIRRILVKKLTTPSPLAPLVRQKISGYLVRQGFAWNLVQEVVKTWESE